MASRSFDKLTKARKSSRLLCSYCYRVETPLLHGLAGLFCCLARRGVRSGASCQGAQPAPRTSHSRYARHTSTLRVALANYLFHDLSPSNYIKCTFNFTCIHRYSYIIKVFRYAVTLIRLIIKMVYLALSDL